ncbi:MAG TPA: AraC family transcriptional regulator [Candidatus Pelethocola excrementipullorum]|nr:AraC family transcriptional regulator [Candidatus Pelethocola excrementipullorum]
MNIQSKIHVLVVEDEPLILSNISKKVELAASYFTVSGKAENGHEALKILAENPQIQLIITDIEMPGMNGLEMIQTVQKTYPHIHIIILSGYSNFEYARTALRYGVNDYLLKPVSQDALNNVLDPISQMIFNEENTEVRNILSTTIHGTLDNDFLPYHFRDGKFLLLLVTLGNLPSKHVPEDSLPEYRNLWKKLNLEQCLHEYTAVERTWLIDESDPMQRIMIIYTSKKILNFASIIHTFHDYLKEALDHLPFSITMIPQLIAYQELWNHAKVIREYHKFNTILFEQKHSLIPDTFLPPAPPKSQPKDLKDTLLQFTSRTALTTFIEKTLQGYIGNQKPQYLVDDFLYQVYSLLPGVFSIEEVHCIRCMNQILGKLYTYETFEQLWKDINESLIYLFNNHSQIVYGDTLSDKVKQYITENYNHKINLNKLAERYGYTPSYLHRTFKKELGVSPLQYMTSIRINQAKQLLLEMPGVDIKEIALRIGYDDSRYFSRVFKNEVGMSPSQWLKNNPPLNKI